VTVRQLTRPPAVAGRFYPADPTRLAETVDALLAGARVDSLPPDFGSVRAVVVPHAAYQYSGRVAAAAFALLAAQRPAAVVLLGPSHFVAVSGCAVPCAAAWRTPLGPVPVDLARRDAAALLPGVRADDQPHEPEHSLEVQLPFLQRTLGPVPVLPVAAHMPPAAVADLLDSVVDDLTTTVLVSTDLSHYRPDPVARDLDAGTAAAVLDLRPDLVADDAACGAPALRGLLSWARRHGLIPHQLALGTSADTGGDPGRVVGYGAFAFTSADECR
jgi:AmmeMemoRadiSam system protein B